MKEGYVASDRLSSIISDNYKVLQVMSRFGISLGFGDKSVEQVCSENDVHCATFLSVLNLVSGGNADVDSISVAQLVDYLKASHLYFTGYMLPEIRAKLLSSVDCSSRNEVAFYILKFFDEYANEVSHHMDFENDSVFTYVTSLLEGRLMSNFTISMFARQHSHTDHEGMDGKLAELKNIFVRYCPKTDNNNKLNSVLFDIFACEEDLASHCLVEERLFVPAVRRLEEQVSRNPSSQTDFVSSEAKEELSDREKEIVASVARGLINKEIADQLCISVNTVITHRRNIAKKLGIHSTAALTIYAIVNHFIDINEVKA